jgi:LacI family transcriptional regulator
MAEKLTIQDIARLAGVSKATVSRVLNQKPDVDTATRERILRIMDEQGFVPSIAASGLAGGRSRLLGVLVPALTWPLIPEIMRGVGDVIEASSYELILYSITEANHEKDRSDVIDRIVGTKLASGLLAIFPGPSALHLGKLHNRDFPVVLLDDQRLPPENTPWISADNRVGAYEATRHLLQLGHRRIAHIQGPLKYRVSHERYEGYCEALREAGIMIDPALVMQGDFKPAGGRACARAFFELPERPTAIFAASDYMAFGVMAAAEEYGLRIPDDLALVGFDDLPASAHMQPALTTVKQPFFEMGQRGIELLLSLVDAPRSVPAWNGHSPSLKSSRLTTGVSPQLQDEPVRIQLATSLVVRASCGASQRSSIPL